MSENCKIWEGKYWDNRNEGNKKEKKKKNFGSSLFNKNDGKVKNYYYSLNEGTFVILLLKVIFFLIFPLQLGRNQLVWIG